MNQLQRLKIYLILMGVGIAGLVLFVLYPSVQGLVAQKQALNTLSGQIQMNAEVSSGSLELEEFEAQLEVVNDLYNKVVMTDENQLQFLDLFEELNRDDFTTQITFNPTEKILIKRETVTPFTIKILSSLPKFLEYLSDIEKSEHYLLIFSIEVKPLSMSQGSDVSTVAIIEGFVNTQ